jgi:hypothetical protein
VAGLWLPLHRLDSTEKQHVVAMSPTGRAVSRNEVARRGMRGKLEIQYRCEL